MQQKLRKPVWVRAASFRNLPDLRGVHMEGGDGKATHLVADDDQSAAMSHSSVNGFNKRLRMGDMEMDEMRSRTDQDHALRGRHEVAHGESPGFRRGRNRGRELERDRGYIAKMKIV